MLKQMAMFLVLVSAQACSNAESAKPEAVAAESSNAVKSDTNGERHVGEDITGKAASLAESCKIVNKTPSNYNEETRIRCTSPE